MRNRHRIHAVTLAAWACAALVQANVASAGPDVGRVARATLLIRAGGAA